MVATRTGQCECCFLHCAHEKNEVLPLKIPRCADGHTDKALSNTDAAS